MQGHGQLHQIPAGVGVQTGLVVVLKLLHAGTEIGLGLAGGDLIHQGLCLGLGNHGPDKDLGILHRGVDLAILIQGLELIMQLVLRHVPHIVQGGDFHNFAHAGGSVDDQIANLIHGSLLCRAPPVGAVFLYTFIQV